MHAVPQIHLPAPYHFIAYHLRVSASKVITISVPEVYAYLLARVISRVLHPALPAEIACQRRPDDRDGTKQLPAVRAGVQQQRAEPQRAAHISVVDIRPQIVEIYVRGVPTHREIERYRRALRYLVQSEGLPQVGLVVPHAIRCDYSLSDNV